MSCTVSGAVAREAGTTTNGYCEAVPIVTKRPDREDELQECTMRVQYRFTEQDHGLQLLRMLVANDDDDVSFLHVLELNRNDFQALKEEQGILVDFNDFPENLVLLLEKCRKSRGEETPSFQAVLTLSAGESKLQIIQTNDFIKLPHVTLKLTPGDDTAVKQFLLLHLSELKTRCRELEKRLEASKAQRENVQSELVQTQGRLDRLALSQQQELAVAVCNDTNVPMIGRDQIDRTDCAVEKRLQDELEHLNSQNETKTAQNMVLVLEKEELAAKVSDLENRLALAEGQQTTCEDDCGGLRKQIQLLRDGKRDLELQVDVLRVSRDGLKEQVSNHSESLDQFRQQIESLQGSNQQLQRRCEELMQSVVKAEEKAKESEAEKKKAEQIIEKFSSELQMSKEKTKKKQALLMRQEEQVHQLQDKLQETEKMRDQIQSEYETVRREALHQETINQELRQHLNSTQGWHSNQGNSGYLPMHGSHRYQRWDHQLPPSNTYHTVQRQPQNVRIQSFMPYQNRQHVSQDERRSGSQDVEMRYHALRE